VLDWFQTEEEIIIYLTVSANADTHHVQYKLKSTYLEVRERGVSLIQAHLPHPVQVDGSNWQFGEQTLCTLLLQLAVPCNALSQLGITCCDTY